MLMSFMLFIEIVSFSLLVIQLVYIFASPSAVLKTTSMRPSLNTNFLKNGKPPAKISRKTIERTTVLPVLTATIIYTIPATAAEASADENSRL